MDGYDEIKFVVSRGEWDPRQRHTGTRLRDWEQFMGEWKILLVERIFSLRGCKMLV